MATFRDFELRASGGDVTSIPGFLAAIDDGTDYVGTDVIPRCTIHADDYSGLGGGVNWLDEGPTLPLIANTDADHPVTIRGAAGTRTGWGVEDCISLRKSRSFTGVVIADGHINLQNLGLRNLGSSSPRGITGFNQSLHMHGVVVDQVLDGLMSTSADTTAVACVVHCTGVGINWQVKSANCLVNNAATGYRSFNSASFYATVRNDIAYNCTTSYLVATYHADSANNAATDGATVTPPGTTPYPNDVIAGDFVAAGTDWTLSAGSGLRDSGTDLTAPLGADWIDFFGTPFDALISPVGPYQPVSAAVALSPDKLNQGQTLGVATLSLAATLQPGDMVQGQSIDAAILSAQTQLSCADVEQGQLLDDATCSLGFFLAGSHIEQGQTLDSTTLQALTALQCADLEQGQILDEATCSVGFTLSGDGINQGQTIDQADLSSTAQLAAADMEQIQTLDTATLTLLGSLSPVDISQGQTLDQVGLSTVTALIADDLEQGQLLESAVLVIDIALSPSQLTQGQLLDNATLIGLAGLIIDDLTQSQFLDGAALSLGTLSPDDLVQAQLMDVANLDGGEVILSIGYSYSVNAAKRTYLVH